MLIETSGLADPAPILHALMTDAASPRRHTLRAVVTLVDALHGEAALDRHPEAAARSMLADRILLTKPDLASDRAALKASRDPERHRGPLREAAQGAVPRPTGSSPGQRAAARPRWPPGSRRAIPHGTAPARHHRRSSARRQIAALALTLWLQGLAEHAAAHGCCG